MIQDPIILAIDTSCDETAAAVVWGRRILSNVISSQVDIHQKYGGVYPALAKRAHQERIDGVVTEALKRASIAYRKLTRGESTTSITSTTGITSKDHDESTTPIFNSKFLIFKERSKHKIQSSKQSMTISDRFPVDAVAVTQGPGLAIALEVGILKAKELALLFNSNIKIQDVKSQLKNQNDNQLNRFPIRSGMTRNDSFPLIAVNHLEGHILSTIAQNSQGNPKRDILFPALALVVSGGNTQMLLVKKIGEYEMIGETLDDACGEALDKAARILQLGYPGGPIIERLAKTGDPKQYVLNPALTNKNNLNFSYSGLKTAFLYLVQKLPEKEFGSNLNNLAACFQYWAFEQIIRKLTKAIEVYCPKSVLCGGGVIANRRLRYLIHRSVTKLNLPLYFPTNKLLYGDNAAMVGVAAYYKYLRGEFIKPEELDRKPRLTIV